MIAALDPSQPTTDGHATGQAMPIAPPASRYGDGRRPNLAAALGSFGIVGGLLAAFVAMGIVPHHRMKHPPLVIVDLNIVPPPAPPPPPAAAATPAPARTVPAEVVAPAPIVQTAAPAPAIATTPVAPPTPVVVTQAPAPAGPPAPPAPAAPAGPVDGGDLSSRMVSADPPSYPLDCRRKREQGTVMLQVLLATDGRVSSLSVVRSSGSERLDKAALDAVRRWRWAPIVRDGAPVMVSGRVRIPFVLRDRDA